MVGFGRGFRVTFACAGVGVEVAVSVGVGSAAGVVDVTAAGGGCCAGVLEPQPASSTAASGRHRTGAIRDDMPRTVGVTRTASR